jgi:hypothetical protein
MPAASGKDGGSLPGDNDLGNLVAVPDLQHTRITYHRTWETGLGSEIRVTDFSPDFLLG